MFCAALRAPNAKPSLGPVGSAHPSEPVWWQGAGVGSQVKSRRWSGISTFRFIFILIFVLILFKLRIGQGSPVSVPVKSIPVGARPQAGIVERAIFFEGGTDPWISG